MRYFLLALLASLTQFTPVAKADCIQDAFGGGVCGIGPCMVGAAGKAACSQFRHGECARGAAGGVACGWRCASGANGEVKCTQMPGGECAAGANGAVTCGWRCAAGANGQAKCTQQRGGDCIATASGGVVCTDSVRDHSPEDSEDRPRCFRNRRGVRVCR